MKSNVFLELFKVIPKTVEIVIENSIKTICEDPDSGKVAGVSYIWNTNGYTFFISNSGNWSIVSIPEDRAPLVHMGVFDVVLKSLNKVNYGETKDFSKVILPNTLIISGNKKACFDDIWDKREDIQSHDNDDEAYRLIFITGRYWLNPKVICFWNDFENLNRAHRDIILKFMKFEGLGPSDYFYGDRNSYNSNSHLTYSEFNNMENSPNKTTAQIDPKRHIMDPILKNILKNQNAQPDINEKKDILNKLKLSSSEIDEILNTNGK